MASKTCLATAFALISLFLGWLCAWGMFLQCPCHRESHSPSPNVCGRLEGREAGRGPTSWRYHSTIVRILQEGDGGEEGGWFSFGLRPPGGKGLSWPAPLSRPHRPPTFSRTGGLPLYPGRGLRPLHPAWGREGAPFSHPGRRDASWLALEYEGRDKALPPRTGIRLGRGASLTACSEHP